MARNELGWPTLPRTAFVNLIGQPTGVVPTVLRGEQCFAPAFRDTELAQAARGVFILCSGRVRLSTTAADGTTLIARISRQGDVLGLPATLTGQPYELTAEVIEPTRVNFIRRMEFLKFIGANGDAALRLSQQWAEFYHRAVTEMRTIGVAHTAGEKLARFLLAQLADSNGKDHVRLTLTFTHEEMGQMLGLSRETVSSAFADLKRKQLIEVKGSSVNIVNRARLEETAAGLADSGVDVTTAAVPSS